jgi:hypothetical protein
MATRAEGETQDDEAGLRPDQIVAKRAKAVVIARRGDPDNFIQLQKATVEVLKSDKQLADDYKNARETLSEVKS